MVDYDLCHCHCHTVPHLVIKGVTRCRTFFENLTVKQIFLEKYESFVIEVFVVFIAMFYFLLAVSRVIGGLLFWFA